MTATQSRPMFSAQAAGAGPPAAPASPTLRYGAAILLALVGVLLTAAGRILLAPSIFLLCYPLVVLAAWYGGSGPGLLSVLLLAVGVDVWVLPPVGSVAMDPDDIFRMVTFVLLGAMVAEITASQRRARREADARALEAAELSHQLQEQALELEQQLEESQQMQEELEEQQNLLTDAHESMILEQRRLRLVGDASHLLASSLDFAATIRAVAQAFVPELSDWCSVDMLVNPESEQWPPELERVAVAHQDPARVAWASDFYRRFPTDWTAESGLPRVIRTGRPEFVPVITDELLVASARNEQELALLREIGFTGFICVPIKVGEQVQGAITLAMTDSGRHYTESDLRLAEDVAGRASVAIQHARLYDAAQRAREEAEEANRAKTEFLAVMSHELRTPLNAIGGYAQLIELGVRGEINEQQREDLQRIQRSARHLLSLINQILNFARIDAGQVKLQPARVPVHDAFGDVEALVGPQMVAKNIAFVREPPGDDVVLWCDPEKLQQILLNLLSNAIKFTPDGGSVTLWCQAEGEFAHVLVQDTGPGIPAEKLESIFEPFVQLERGLTSRQEGAGLGLAISRELARAMGGELGADARSGGARFRLILPMVHDSRGA